MIGTTPQTAPDLRRSFLSEKATSGQRANHYLFIDEADKVLAEDMAETFHRGRKRGVSLICSVQHPSQLTNRFTSIEDAAFSQPKLQITFRQTAPSDLENLGFLFGTLELDFTEAWRPMDRPDGHGTVIVMDTSETCGQSFGRSEGTSDTQTSGTSDSTGLSKSRGSSAFTSRGLHEQKGKSTNSGATSSDSRSFSHSANHSTSRSTNHNKSESHTISYKTTHLARHRAEWYRHGLESPINDQFWCLRKLIRGLDVAQCLISSGIKKTQLVTIHYFSTPFEDLPKARAYFLQKILTEMWSLPFFFKPGDIQCLPNAKYKKPKGSNGSSDSAGTP